MAKILFVTGILNLKQQQLRNTPYNTPAHMRCFVGI
jgi:hypothetical protein